MVSKPKFFINCRFKIVWLIIILVTSLLISQVYSDETDYMVKLPNGNNFIGLVQTSLYSEKEFIEFRGIPYAKADRFQAPKKYEDVWSEPKKALEYGPVCPQINLIDEIEDDMGLEGYFNDPSKMMGQEDCLFINVATPSVHPTDKKYPVAVWINGGSFKFESGDAYGPKKFMEHDVVLVTFNFRIGALGFLNTGDGMIQGNMGLKDQVVALQWVKENIQSFGGDPDSVTLMGTNAGAVSAHLHMLSPMSKGLFHRAIIQSGSAIAPWAIARNPEKTAQKLAKSLKCESSSLTDCFTNADWKNLTLKQETLTEWFIDPLVALGPTIETLGDSPKFLSEHPYKILTSGDFWAKDKVPFIIGVNSDEGLLHSVDLAHSAKIGRVFNMEWMRAAPISLMLRETCDTPGLVSTEIKTFYFGDVIKRDTEGGKSVFMLIGRDFYKFEELTNMYSDRYFNIPLHHTAKLHGKFSSDVFLYWFDYLGEISTTQLSGYNSSIFGVSHFDQIQYMFNTPYLEESTKPEDIEFGKRFVTGIVKFVSSGAPPAEEKWVKVSKEMVEGSVPLIYNRIGSPKNSNHITETFTERVKFWDQLPIKEYEKSLIIKTEEVVKVDTNPEPILSDTKRVEL